MAGIYSLFQLVELRMGYQQDTTNAALNCCIGSTNSTTKGESEGPKIVSFVRAGNLVEAVQL